MSINSINNVNNNALLGVELEILKYPNPELKKISEPVTEFNDELKEFIEKMYRTMRACDGVGLAAPQVGVLKTLAVVEYDNQAYTLINPRVIDEGGEQEGEEGCLSFPGIYAQVKRPQWVKIEAQDETGAVKVYEVKDFIARAFLHEMDHLTGKLFIDYLSNIKRNAIKKKMQKHNLPDNKVNNNSNKRKRHV